MAILLTYIVVAIGLGVAIGYGSRTIGFNATHILEALSHTEPYASAKWAMAALGVALSIHGFYDGHLAAAFVGMAGFVVTCIVKTLFGCF